MQEMKRVDEALQMIALLERRAIEYRATNKVIADAVGERTSEYTHALQMIDGEIFDALRKMLDDMLGLPDSDLTSYYLHECVGPLGHGGGIESGGKNWRLRNIKDLRRYVMHARGEQEKATA